MARPLGEDGVVICNQLRCRLQEGRIVQPWLIAPLCLAYIEGELLRWRRNGR
jgi:hypothetical protein